MAVLTSPLLQAFLDVYATLREELLNDKLLEGQPQAAKDWLKEVGLANCVLRAGLAVFGGGWVQR